MESAELINFLDPKFEPTATCSCTTDDFYTVDNLISADRQKSQLGFMAYHVVKPPIELHFSLVCRIELSAIKLWTQINSLKSTGFEILVNGSNASREYQKIGSHFNLRASCLEFSNNQGGGATSPDCNASLAFARFYSSTRNVQRKVKNIKVCIKQTNRCCVPVLKRIEIWGKVSMFEKSEQHEQIRRLIAGASAEAMCPDDTSSSSDDDTSVGSAENPEKALQNSVPETFLDAITYEIMALPMILPSGKVIDNSSLVRHNEEEVRWGRLPSDPFTGQMFTDTRKPILDVRLKSQIDAFLLKNCDNSALGAVPRTVGTLKKRKLDAIDGRLTNAAATTSAAISGNAQAAKTVCAGTESAKASDSAGSSHPTTISSHISIVHDILRTRKYTSKTTQNAQKICRNNCYQCQTNHETDSNSLYLIRLCSHLICRTCLVDGNLDLCKCGQKFSNFHVKKYHITREI